MPKLCESCGSYDPTLRLTADSRCPRCGVVYARVAQPSTAGVRAPADLPKRPAASCLATTEPDAGWLPLERTDVWLSVAAVCALFAIILFDDDGFVVVLDHANLAFHEAGHPFFGMLGGTLGLYGGTLGQLVFPIVAAVSFWRRRHAVGVALSGVWLFENFLNIARYMADARAQPSQDVYTSTSLWGFGFWSAPQNLGPNVNTDGNETRATISADGKRLHFGRDGDFVRARLSRAR
jgi:hypothetical protein